MVNLLEVFLSISGLELNWDKFLASWSYERYKEKPSWAQNFNGNGPMKVTSLNFWEPHLASIWRLKTLRTS
jgi:hypothetical protein